MDEQEVIALLKKYREGTLSPDEKAKLETWYISQASKGEHKLSRDEVNETLQSIREQLPLKYEQPVKLRPYTRYAAAASIVLALSLGGYFILHKRPVQQTAQNQKHDIAPGRNQATLTLANGSKIILTKALRGQIAQQGNTLIKAGSGEAITYTGASVPETKVEYNTLSTAKGEMSPYPLVLADGTKVWLNAASSITFPTAFPGKERMVTVTGEAYVIVAHNAVQPFKLLAGGQIINDIGTEFNINAYSDEPVVTTTLASGSIRVEKGEKSVLIKPGQQAVSNNSTTNIAINSADLEAVLAWKNGKFEFDNADVPAVMRQIARWYNVDVVYEGGIPNATINGGVFRNTNASNALKIVRLLGIPYRIEGRKIIITNTK